MLKFSACRGLKCGAALKHPVRSKAEILSGWMRKLLRLRLGHAPTRPELSNYTIYSGAMWSYTWCPYQILIIQMMCYT